MGVRCVRKQLQISAKSKIVKILLIFIIPLIMLLGGYNFYVQNLIMEQSIEYGRSMLDIYSQPLESELEIVESYLENIVWYDQEFRKLVYAKTSRKAHARLEDVNDKIQNIYSTALHMAGHIIYHTGTEQAKAYYDSKYSYKTKKIHMEFMLNHYEEVMEKKPEEWMYCAVENDIYLVRFFSLKGTVLMGIYDLNKVNVPQANEEMQQDYIFIANEDKEIISYVEQVEKMGVKLKNDAGDVYITQNAGKKFLVVEKKLESLMLYMVYVTPYHGNFTVDRMPLFFLCFSLFVVILLGVSIWMIHKSYIVPLKNMVDTMTEIKNGKMENRMEDEYQISEFSVVTKTFNDMLDRIQDLKIASYEEKFETQRAMMLYRQIQIRPHFILNCLKNVFSLAQEEKYKEIQETVLVLSKYMRFFMKDDLMWVRLDEELKNVENYIYLQQLLGTDEILYECQMEEKNMGCFQVPILSILTFVENSVKHGKRAGKKLIITIKISIIADFLNITILDNGVGFSEEKLEYLNKKDFSGEHQHIGIQNVLHRFAIVYHGKCEVIFSNTYGANVDIFIPLEKMGRYEDGGSDC